MCVCCFLGCDRTADALDSGVWTLADARNAIARGVNCVRECECRGGVFYMAVGARRAAERPRVGCDVRWSVVA